MSSIGRFGVDGEVRAKDWNSGGEGSTGGGETGDTATPAVSMEFSEGSNLTETVGVTASTPTASSVKQLTITPQGSLEKYSIYVQTTSSTTGALVGKDKKETISAISDTTSTGGVELASIGVNQWGYALETGQKTADAMKYKGVSGSGTAVSAYDSIANPTSAQEFTLAFAANIGNDKPADHYMANVLVSVAANPGEVTTLYSVSYSTNGSTGGATPATQTAESSSDTYMFKTSMGEDLTKTGYTLIGWATNANAITPEYEPGSTITLSAMSPVKILYAIWGFNYSVTYNANGGSNPPITQKYATTATSYTFTVASQGNMKKANYVFLGWSESNNATTAQYTAGSSQLTLSNSNPNKTLYAVWRPITILTITNMNELTTAVCGNSAQGDSKALKDTSTGNGGKSYTVTKLKDGNCWMTANMDNSTGRIYQSGAYGGYYTNEGNGSNDGDTITSSNAVNICTHMGGGWKLPTKNQYDSMASGTNSAIMSSPYYFQYGGLIESGSLLNSGSQGDYWTATVQGTGRAYQFQVYSGRGSTSSLQRTYGMSVRCLVLGS